MGIDDSFGMAFAKSQLAANNALPMEGTAFLSVQDKDKNAIISVAARLLDHGFEIVTTEGTGKALAEHGLKCRTVLKHYEGEPNIIAPLKSGKIAMVINTHEGKLSAKDSYEIRRSALESGTPYFTTLAAAEAAVRGISEMRRSELQVKAIQDYFGGQNSILSKAI